jgi:hypothetical protein
MAQNKFTFLPWIRKGLAKAISQTEASANPASYRPSITARVDLQSTTITKEIQIQSAADVLRINPSAILRMDPIEGSAEMEDNYLASIEFYDEDLPWRFTPAQPDPATPNRLSPWIFLMVLKNSTIAEGGNQIGEFSIDTTSMEYPKVVLNSDVNFQHVLPPNNEIYAWAHVQVNHSFTSSSPTPTEIVEAIKADANCAFSRLICPRKLDLDTSYTAFVIPTYELGRLAGAETIPSGVHSLTKAWDNSNPTDIDKRKFPFYHSWEFRTSNTGNFETLAAKIVPQEASAALSGRPMYIGDLGMGIDIETTPAPNRFIQLEGALKGLGAQDALITANPIYNDLTSQIKDRVNAQNNTVNTSEFFDFGTPDDPGVMPPLYGQWHSLSSSVENDSAEWIKEINLDPRSRVAASIGAEIVKRNQEELMTSAWEQVDDILSAVQKITIAEVATRVGQVAFEKHIKHPKEDINDPQVRERLLTMTYNLSSNIRLDNEDDMLTIKKHIEESKVPSAVLSNAFKKVIRPGLKRSSLLSSQTANGGIGLSKGLVHRYISEPENALQRSMAERKTLFPADAVPTSVLIPLANSLEGNYANYTQLGDSLYYQAGNVPSDTQGTYTNALTQLSDAVSTLLTTTPLIELQEGVEMTLEERTSPKLVIQEKLAGIIQVKNLTTNEYVDFNVEFWNADTNTFNSLSDSYSLASSISNEVLPYPEFDMPIYELLKDVSPDYIIPNIDQIQDNSATVLEPNPRFIEALFAGLNHEFGRELLWREYPTDQRGSYFRKFWDRSDSDDAEVNDIDLPLHQWNNSLGANTGMSGDYLILVIRGELLRKFPNTLIFAKEATFVDPVPTTPEQMEDASRMPKLDGLTVYPKFTAQLGQDVTLVAFEMTKETALGKNSVGVNINAGYFFCLQERPGEMRFGLSGATFQTPMNWLELSWQAIENPGVLNSSILVPTSSGFLEHIWFFSSGDMASILMRQPVNYIMDSKTLIL